jgi:hypothetical protein
MTVVAFLAIAALVCFSVAGLLRLHDSCRRRALLNDLWGEE